MFGRRIPLFRLFGFEIAIDTSWLFLAFLITWSLAMGIFPFTVPNLSSSAYWIMGVLGALGLFGSVLLHEISHSFVARYYGVPMKGITLFLFGGVAHMEGEPQSPKVEFRIAAVGPIVSVFIGIILYGVLSIGTELDWPESAKGVVGYLSTINFILAFFNLVPAFPLDGGRMLRAGLWKWKRNFVDATRLATGAGNVFSWVLIFFGFLWLFRGNLIGGLWWIFIGMFLRGAAKMSYRQVLISDALEGETVERFMTRNPITVPPNISLQEFVGNYLYRYHHKMFPVSDSTRLLGCIHMSDLRSVPKAQWKERRVMELVKPCSGENTVSPRTDAGEALKLMGRTGNSRLVVAEGDRLCGVIVLKDLMKSLSLRLELDGYGREVA